MQKGCGLKKTVEHILFRKLFIQLLWQSVVHPLVFTGAETQEDNILRLILSRCWFWPLENPPKNLFAADKHVASEASINNPAEYDSDYQDGGEDEKNVFVFFIWPEEGDIGHVQQLQEALQSAITMERIFFCFYFEALMAFIHGERARGNKGRERTGKM